MKYLRNMGLVIAAICVARVMVTVVGILISVIPMMFELSDHEAELKFTYEILTAYSFIVLTLLIATVISLYGHVKYRILYLYDKILAIVSLIVFGTHLIFAAIGAPNKHLLVQFANSFIWVPLLAGTAVLISLFISRAQSSHSR